MYCCQNCQNRDPGMLLLKTDRLGKYLCCRLCHEFTWLREEISDEETIRYITHYEAGMRDLRSYHFNQAQAAFDEALKLFSDRIEALWGRICARYGIVELHSYEERSGAKPTFCYWGDNDLSRDEDLQRLSKQVDELPDNEENREIKAIYRGKIDCVIEQFKNIKRALLKEAKEYDAFIACKISRKTQEKPLEDGRTTEFTAACELYDQMTKQGLKVFFSYKSINLGEIDYDWRIFNALLSSRHFILVSGGQRNMEYLETPWVRSEWKRWIYMMEKKYVEENSFFIYQINAEGATYPAEIDALRLQRVSPFQIDQLIETLHERRPDDSTVLSPLPESSAHFVDPLPQKVFTARLVSPQVRKSAEKAQSFMNENQWESAEQHLDKSIAKIGRASAGNLNLLRWLVTLKCKSIDDLTSLETIKPDDHLAAALETADSDVGTELLNTCYTFCGLSGLSEADEIALLGIILPYAYRGREKQIEKLAAHAIREKRTKSFSLLLRSPENADAKRFLELNERMIAALPEDHPDVKTYVDNGLLADPHNPALLGRRCRLIAREIATAENEDYRRLNLLDDALNLHAATAANTNELIDGLWRTFRTLRPTMRPQDTKFMKRLVSHYMPPRTGLIGSLLELIADYIRRGMYEDATYFNDAVIAVDDRCAQAWLNRCLIEAKVHYLDEIVMSDIRLDACSGFTTYCSLVDQERLDRITALVEDQIHEIAARQTRKAEQTEMDSQKVTYRDHAVVCCDPGVKMVELQPEVVGLSDRAFRNCACLQTITLPESVEMIGRYAFDGCAALDRIRIPRVVSALEDYTFRGCTSLTFVTLPEKLETIGWGAFRGCSRLQTVTLPDSVSRIGGMAFWGCAGLTSITMPARLNVLGQQAFCDCSGLVDITIPDGVVSIREGTFENCTSLASVSLPKGLKFIFKTAFANCPSLKTIRFRGTKKELARVSAGWNIDFSQYQIVTADGAGK